MVIEKISPSHGLSSSLSLQLIMHQALLENAAIKDAKRIQALGIIPWVSNAALDNLGVGSVVVDPRTVLVIYQNQPVNSKDDINALQMLGMPLEYLGYKPRFIAYNQPLPTYPLNGRVAGIILWLTQSTPPYFHRTQSWLEKQIHPTYSCRIYATLWCVIHLKIDEKLGPALQAGKNITGTH